MGNQGKKKESRGAVPFGKAVRVGNFKLWRGRCRMGNGEIGVLNVSSLDGTWMTRIPSTVEMYGWLCMSYGDYMGDDAERRRQGEAVLTTVLSNMLYASSITNGYYQRALEMCATAYAHPSLLDKRSKGHKGFMKDVKALTEMFLEWRGAYDERVKAMEPTETEMRQDGIADEAMETLAGEG